MICLLLVCCRLTLKMENGSVVVRAEVEAVAGLLPLETGVDSENFLSSRRDIPGRKWRRARGSVPPGGLPHAAAVLEK